MVPVHRTGVGQVRSILLVTACSMCTYQALVYSCSFETKTRVRLRFVAGYFEDSAAQYVLNEDRRAHDDFYVANVRESYDNMMLKVHTLDL